MSKLSKSKGSSFERKIAKELSLWLTNNKRDDTLWRSAMSGGRATIVNRAGGNASAQMGDLSSIDVESDQFIKNFAVELKHYKDLKLLNLLYGGGKDGFPGFYSKVLKEAKDAGKQPLLIAKQNHKSVICGTTATGYSKFFNDSRYKIATFHQRSLVVFEFDKLLKYGEFK